jgi:hypothetical protein
MHATNGCHGGCPQQTTKILVPARGPVILPGAIVGITSQKATGMRTREIPFYDLI